MLGLKSRRRHRRALIASVVIGVIVVGIGGGGAWSYFAVKAQATHLESQIALHLRNGQTDLEAAKSSLKQANTKIDETLIAQAKAHFSSARTEFALAGEVTDHSQLLLQLEKLPAVGGAVRSRHAAVDSIAEMGIALSDAGQDLADIEGQLIKPVGPKGSGGHTLLTVLTATQGSLADARAKLRQAQVAAASVDLAVLSTAQQATLLKARDTIAVGLDGLDQFQSLVPILKEVLGGNGVRTYLVEQANPAELRPGGGFIGTYSVVTANSGVFKVIRSGNAYDLANPRPHEGQPGYVAPPGPLRVLIPTTSWSFVDSNFFPDFISNAKTAETFVQPRLGVKIDGVISMDYYAVAAILQLTGPLAVPGYGITVNGSNFIPTVISYELAAKDASHKGMLSAIASPLMTRVVRLGPAKWPALIGVLNGLAAARHLQVYFNNPAVENQINQYGWSGGLNPSHSADYMTEVEANLGATKANYFVTRHYTVALTRHGNTLHHQVTVDLTNNMPYFYRPNEFYRAYIRLFVETKASGLSDNLLPGKYPDPSPPPGMRMVAGWLTIPGYGQTGQVVFDYDTPWRPDATGGEQIYWQKQPGTVNDGVDVSWNNGSGHTYKVSGSLAQDRVITLTPNGVTLTPGVAAQAKLPSLSLG